VKKCIMHKVGFHGNRSLLFFLFFVPFPMVSVFRVPRDMGFPCAIAL
jgi:hypothetical protein